MSWNKNTVVCSEVDSTVRVLKDLGYPYELKVLGEVRGRGLNDDIINKEGEFECRSYPIRELRYEGSVIRETMLRHYDCDADDAIVSKTYNVGEGPKEIILESSIKEEEDFCEQDW